VVFYLVLLKSGYNCFLEVIVAAFLRFVELKVLLHLRNAGFVADLTSKNRVKVFIIDDSMCERNRSNSVEFLARFRDHAWGVDMWIWGQA